MISMAYVKNVKKDMRCKTMEGAMIAHGTQVVVKNAQSITA